MQNLLEQPTGSQPGVAALAWQQRRLIAAVWCCGMFLTLAYFATATRQYRSEAKIYVRLGRETVALDPTATTGHTLGVSDTRGNEIYAVEELLTSRPLAEKIVDKFGPLVILDKDPENPGKSLGQRLAFLDWLNLNPLRVYSVRDKAIKAFQESLRVSSGSKTNTIAVAYQSENPQLAHDVLKAYLDEACDEHLRVHRTKGSREFFVGQSEQLRTHLGKLSAESRDLKNKTGVASLTIQRELKLQLIGSLQSDLVRARAEQDAVEAELDRRRKHLADVPALNVTEQTVGAPHSTDQTLREKLYDLEVKEQEYAAKYTPQHPVLVEIRNQLAESRRIFEAEATPVEVKTGINQTHKTAELAVQEREASLVAITARIDSLEAKIKTAQSELNLLNDHEIEIDRLDREIDLARANSRKYAENMEQARINQELEEAKISSLNLLQAPSVAETPISPKPIPTLAVGFVLSLLGSLGVAVAVNHRHAKAESKNNAGAPASATNGAARSFATIFSRRVGGITEPRTLAVIVPCHNESDGLENLAAATDRLRAALPGQCELELLLVDDGSTDDTWNRMHELFGDRDDVTLLKHKMNQGIAAAIGTGLAHAHSDVVASLDADCTYDPEILVPMLKLLDDHVDMVVASPYHPAGSVQGVAGWRLALSRMASRMYGCLLHNKLHTYTSCVRVYRRDSVVQLPVQNGGFVGVVELLWQLDRSGGKIVEYPALLRSRTVGQSKMRVVRTTWAHLRLLANIAWQQLTSPPAPATPAVARIPDRSLEHVHN